MFGLSDKEIDEINNVFGSYSGIEKVILFGSRAMGNYKPGSDIDLAVIGEKISLNDIFLLNIKLEDLGMLYKFDLQNYNSIDNPDVLAHINRVGIPFFTKKAII